MKQGFHPRKLAEAQAMANKGATVEQISDEFQVWPSAVEEFVDFPDPVTIAEGLLADAVAKHSGAEKDLVVAKALVKEKTAAVKEAKEVVDKAEVALADAQKG